MVWTRLISAVQLFERLTMPLVWCLCKLWSGWEEKFSCKFEYCSRIFRQVQTSGEYRCKYVRSHVGKLYIIECIFKCFMSTQEVKGSLTPSRKSRHKIRSRHVSSHICCIRNLYTANHELVDGFEFRTNDSV